MVKKAVKAAKKVVKAKKAEEPKFKRCKHCSKHGTEFACAGTRSCYHTSEFRKEREAYEEKFPRRPWESR